MYRLVNENFKVICEACVTLSLFISVLASVKKDIKCINVLWNVMFSIYLLFLIFITILSRQDIHQSVVVKDICFRYIFISRPDVGVSWEDIANVILFLPMGIFLYRCVERAFHGFGCFCVIAFCSICIEFTQYILQCGFCDINDFLNNVMGGICGYLMSHIMHHIYEHRH